MNTQIALVRRSFASFVTHLASLASIIRDDEWLVRRITVRFACQLIIRTTVEAELWCAEKRKILEELK
jgi:hypothetical protein